MRPEVIDADVSGDLIHPGAEAVPRTVRRTIFKNSEENFLDEVLTQRAASRHPAEEIEQWRIMFFEKRVELSGIAFPDRLHYGFIRHVHHGRSYWNREQR